MQQLVITITGMTDIGALADEGPPELNRPRFVCPHCAAFAYQHWYDLGIADGNWGYLETEAPEVSAVSSNEQYRQFVLHPVSLWRAAKCGGCLEFSFWYRKQMVYPSMSRSAGSAAHADMPAEVRELYEEAAAVAPISRRAGAALARATVERLLKHLDADAPKHANLEQRIARIQPRVSTETWQLLEVVRVTGNGAVHVDEQPDEIVIMALDDTEGPALLEMLLETANNLVDELITRPRITSGLWETLPEKIKSKVRPGSSPPPADPA